MQRINGPRAFLRELAALDLNPRFCEIWARVGGTVRVRIVLLAGAYCSAAVETGAMGDCAELNLQDDFEVGIAAYALMLKLVPSPVPVRLETIMSPSEFRAVDDLREFLKQKVDGGRHDVP